MEGPMTAQIKRSFAAIYAVFSSSRNTMVAQIVLVVLFGTLTLVGMNDVARRENNKSISDRLK
jgi:hypothetical protein